MKKLILSITRASVLSIVFLTGIILFAQPSSVVANTLTTSSDTKGGQVITTNQDGTVFLTTQIATPAGSTTQETTANRSNSLRTGMITIPQGFAESFQQLFNSLLSAVMMIAALLVLFYLIAGAFQWITSGGDKGKIEQARNKMFAAVVGIIIVASSYAILILVLNFLGFENLEDLLQNSRSLNERTGIQFVNTAGPTPAPTATPSGQTNLEQLL